MTCLALYAWIAMGVFVAGTSRAWVRWLVLTLNGRQPRSHWNYVCDAPPRRTWVATARALFLEPSRRFHRRSHLIWTFGFWAYHAAVFTVVAMCTLSLSLVVVRWFQGTPPPPANHSALLRGPAQAMLLAFGNGEPATAHFLFGSWAPALRWVGWWELTAAMVGNLALLAAWCRHGMGAVTRDLDAVTTGSRLTGRRSPVHLGVRLIIFAIVQTEWLARFELVPWAVVLHTWLGLTLLLIAPFTYLAHAWLAPLAFADAWRRQRQGVVA